MRLWRRRQRHHRHHCRRPLLLILRHPSCISIPLYLPSTSLSSLKTSCEQLMTFRTNNQATITMNHLVIDNYRPIRPPFLAGPCDEETESCEKLSFKIPLFALFCVFDHRRSTQSRCVRLRIACHLRRRLHWCIGRKVRRLTIVRQLLSKRQTQSDPNIRFYMEFTRPIMHTTFC
jgi:hypothetical protein